MIDPTRDDQIRIVIDVDRDQLPDRVRTALEEVAAALAAEEIVLAEELSAAIDEQSEVSGFGQALTIGSLDLSGGGKFGGPPVNHWCIGRSKDSCGVHKISDGETTPTNCTVRFI